ncbi:hypothetical protein ACHAXH_009233 [Discostella pseudostelligera]
MTMHHDDALDRVALGVNASIPYTIIESSGPACRPLDFPAPIVDKAMTVSVNVVNHRTGHIFRANSVLMRRPTHAKNCPSRGVNDGRIFSFEDSTNRLRGHHRRSTSGSINSGQFHVNVPSTTLASTSPPRCDAAYNFPDKAYCVRKKICNTTYGSMRLCVVLKRVNRHLVSYFASLGISDPEQAVPAWETTDELVAIKVVSWSKLQSLRGRHLEDPVKELAALQLLGTRLPHVISIMDALQDDTHLFCVFPYMSGGDLGTNLMECMKSASTSTIDESLARTWFRQILCGISHLQKKGICHRDLCLENLMLDENRNLRIIDFGLCIRTPFADPNNRKLVSDVSANTYRRLIKTQGQCGSWKYMAPEVCMRYESFDGFAIDLWAAGIILFKLLVGREPFGMPDAVDGNFCAISERGDLAGFLSSQGIALTDTAVDLLQNIMWSDPAKRLTLAEIVDHPWVQGIEKQCVPSSERNESWLIKIKSIDDTEPSNLMLTGLLDSYYESATDSSTDYTLDAAESNFSSPQVSSPPDPTVESPVIAIESLSQMKTKKKRRWLCFPFLKWKRAARATSLAVPSNREFS